MEPVLGPLLKQVIEAASQKGESSGLWLSRDNIDRKVILERAFSTDYSRKLLLIVVTGLAFSDFRTLHALR